MRKVIVHERDRKCCRDTTQKVEIHLNFIGQFIVPQEPIDPEVLAAQEEEQCKKLARQERLHQNYLKRKANGKQQEMERRGRADHQKKYNSGNTTSDYGNKCLPCARHRRRRGGTHTAPTRL